MSKSCCIFSFSLNTYAADDILNKKDKYNCDEKIYSTATIDQNFEDDSVLVVLDKSISEINKTHELSLFNMPNIKSIVDLTAICADDNPASLSINPPTYTKDFRQILKIDLTESSKQNVLSTISFLQNIDGVRYAGPNHVYDKDPLDLSIISNTSSDISLQSIPNSTEIIGQWGLKRIKAPDAWTITTGSASVRVGVIDSGLGLHPDLYDNISNEEGIDCVNGENDVTYDDVTAHGTRVSGIIGADGYSENGLYGVALDVTLIPIQVNESYNPTSSNIVEAFNYASIHNIPIVNFSISSYIYDEAIKQVMVNYSGLIVCAAGNNQYNIDIKPHYPSSYKLDNVIVVGASDYQNTPAIFDAQKGTGSNYGATTVHLFAPGINIRTTNIWLLTNTTEYDYMELEGTSLAAPFVTGVAALIKSLRPNLSAVEIKSLILDNVTPVNALGDKCTSGGILNAYNAVRAATEAETFVGDTNGDGRSDIIMSRNINGKRALTVYLGKSTGGFAEPITTHSVRNFYYDDPAFAGDFNGDDITDIVIHWDSNGKRQLLVYIGKGDGTFYDGTNLSSTRAHDLKRFPSDYFVEDVNGDGKDDFVIHFRDTSGKRSALVYKGTSSAPYLIDAPTNALTSNNKYYDEDPVFMGDFNGDGRSDLLVHWHNTAVNSHQLLVYKGNSDATFSTGSNLDSSITYDPLNIPFKFLVGDVNGDNKDDFISHYKNNIGNRNNTVYLGTASNPYVLEGTNALVSSNDYIPRDPVFIGDVNGDGRDDMIVHWTTSTERRQLLVYTANSNGTYNAGVNFSTTNANNHRVYSGRFFVADVDGDGRDDFIVKWRNGENIAFLTYKGTSIGTFSDAVRSNFTNIIPYFDE